MSGAHVNPERSKTGGVPSSAMRSLTVVGAVTLVLLLVNLVLALDMLRLANLIPGDLAEHRAWVAVAIALLLGLLLAGGHAVRVGLRNARKLREAAGAFDRQLAAFRAAMDGMAVLSPNGTFISVNEAHARTYGYDSPEEVVGQPWHALFDQNERVHLEVEVMPVLARDGRWRGEAVGRRRDGSTFPKEVSFSRLEDGGLVCVVRDLSEKKRDDEARRQSESKYQQLFDNVNDAIVIFEPDTETILEVNQKAVETYGRSREELIGRSLKSFTKDVLRGERHIAELLKVGSYKNFETVQFKKDGTPLHILANTSVVEYEGRKAILAANRDVTEIRKAEEALRERERRFREIVETANEGIWLVDPEGNTSFVNWQMGEILGYDIDEMMGRTLFDFMDEEGLALAQTALEDVPPGATARHELKFRRRDGTEIWALVSTSPVTDASGRYAGAVGMIADITDRKRAEDEIARLFDRSPEMLCVVGYDGFFKRANPAWERAFGYSREELLARPLLDFVHADDRPALAAEQERLATQGGETVSFETRAVAKDGSLRFIQWNARPDPKRQIIHASARDVTEYKRAEEALRQAQKLESLGVLAGGVAHDFNNLLAVILGQNSLALSKLAAGHAARPNLEKSIGAVNRAADLAGKMLSYSGKGHFEIRPIQLSTLIREGQSLYEAAISKNVSLVFDLEDRLPLVEADASQIRQAIMNLILNAAEALGDRPGTVRIATGTRDVGDLDEALWRHTGQVLTPGRYVTLQVRDDGVGMDPDTIPRIFDPFFSTKFVGRGLGLAAVLGVARGHKGGIHVESAPGKGSVFTLVFPAVKTAILTAPPKVTPRQGSILIVEDEAVLREVVREVLETAGYAVLEASSGQEALEIFARDPRGIALVLLDLSMPGMGGEQAFAAIRQTDPEAQVLLTSGFSEAEATRHFGGTGLAGFIQKPYAIPDLIVAVRRCLGEAAVV